MPDPELSPATDAPAREGTSATPRSGYAVLAAGGLVVATAFASIATLTTGREDVGQSPNNPQGFPDSTAVSATHSVGSGGERGENRRASHDQREKNSIARSTTVVVTGPDGKTTTTTVPVPDNNGDQDSRSDNTRPGGGGPPQPPPTDGDSPSPSDDPDPSTPSGTTGPPSSTTDDPGSSSESTTPSGSETTGGSSSPSSGG